MNNIITKTESSLNFKINADNPAVDLLNLFAAYTPQFYKKSTTEEKQKEINKIKFMIDGISIEVLKKMCELAIANYKVAISRNTATRFNLDYFLSFYITAFNIVNAVTLDVSGIYSLESYVNNADGTVTEVYSEKNLNEDNIDSKKYIRRYFPE